MIALLIAYLPTIYGAFSRREVMVTQLSVRAGTPPTPWRALELAHRAGYLSNLDPVWNELFPAEQARVIQLLVERVNVSPEGVDIRLRTEGLSNLTAELDAVRPERKAA